MEYHPTGALISLILIILFLFGHFPAIAACETNCGSIQVRYPFGTDYGCGSPRFYPSITCSPDTNLLTLTTHTGTYPITSISYSTSTLTITPPLMSTCSSMYPSTPNIGLDWSSPFQLGPSILVLLSCPAPTSSLSYGNTPICDSSSSHVCASLLACPAVLSLGLQLFSPTNTCCVYSPANLGPKGELNLHGLRCEAYASVLSFGSRPTDPSTWEYGVALKYSEAEVGLKEDGVSEACGACERSDGVCGYSPPRNYFVCVCKGGVNTSTDCYGQEYWSSSAGDDDSLTTHAIIGWRLSLSSMVVVWYWLVM